MNQETREELAYTRKEMAYAQIQHCAIAALIGLGVLVLFSLIVHDDSNTQNNSKQTEVHKEVDRYLNKKSTNKQIEHAVDEYLAKKNLQNKK